MDELKKKEMLQTSINEHMAIFNMYKQFHKTGEHPFNYLMQKEEEKNRKPTL